jgi:bud site selection protein 20
LFFFFLFAWIEKADMGRQRPKRVHKNDKSISKAHRTRRRTKGTKFKSSDLTLSDLDQIYNEIKQGKVRTPLDLDLPGQGQFFCPSCSRYFINEPTLHSHLKSKPHKKRVKALKEPPYEGPEQDGQLKVDHGPRLRATTQFLAE